MSVRIALAQFIGVEEREHNLRRVEELVGQAAGLGADLVAFHEFAATVYFCYERDDRFFDWAEPIPGHSTDRMSKAADKYGIPILFPLYERAADKFFNTTALIEPTKGVMEIYRKSHVPTVGKYGDERGADEARYFSPGDTGFRAWKTSTGLKIGVLTCYDRHFPEGARAYGLQEVDVIFVPTASYKKSINDLWEIGLQAMAWQNHCYVAGINKVGPLYLQHDKRYPGRSVVVDPEGRIISRIGEEEGLITAEIDPGLAARQREFIRFFDYRRPELYTALTEVRHSLRHRVPRAAR